MAKGQQRKDTPPFTRSPYIDRLAHARPYDPFAQRLRPDARDAAGAVLVSRLPVSRCLRIYTQDPATPRQNIAVATVQVPYEPLAAGPTGCVMHVIEKDETRQRKREPAPKPPEPQLDLDGLGVLAPTGVAPSTGDFKFAQQMTYAVAMVTYDRFRQALGRTPDFSFGPERAGEPGDPDGMVRLHIYPHGMKEDNAYYDPERGALLFGYTFANKRAVGMNQPGGIIYTSLSHDVVVHETAHALLDGMRAKFMLPSNGDVDAFHEGFADLVAIFLRFQYRDLVKQAIKQSADIDSALDSGLLTNIMKQWGEATGEDDESPRKALRNALVAAGGPDDPVARQFFYKRGKEAHDLGAVLVAAVFDAFRWIYGRKTAALRAVGRRPGEPPSTELVDLLTGEAVRLAHQFLDIIIRAVDYCPPVDLTLGEYLRALVTADFDLVPEDPWGYREALVQAFRRYRITVDDVDDLSEESLLWKAPTRPLDPIEGLAFSDLVHRREPGQMSDVTERRRRADALGRFVTRPEHLEQFGLVRPVRRAGLHVEPPVVESIRTIRRIGPDDSLTFDLVGEITQRRKVGRGRWFYGGATVIIDANGMVRYALAKSVMSKRREARFRKNLAAKPALYAQLFEEDRPRTGALLRDLHAPRRARVSRRRRRE